jgi:ribonuclease HI
VSRTVLADLLRFIAANERLPSTLERYKGYDRDTLGKLISAAADRVEEAEKAAAEAAAPRGKAGGLKVRRASEVEKAARASEEELEEAMELSKADRDRKKAERAQAAAREAEAARVEAARPPPRTRLFTDGAARGNPGPAGAGAVIVSAEGHVVAKIGKFLGDNTNNYAEYMGLILGLRRAKAMGIKELDVFADSELVVKQLAGEYQVKAENLRPLYEEARQLLTGFAAIAVSHIPREQNGAADEMSNRAIDQRM